MPTAIQLLYIVYLLIVKHFSDFCSLERRQPYSCNHDCVKSIMDHNNEFNEKIYPTPHTPFTPVIKHKNNLSCDVRHLKTLKYVMLLVTV